MLENMTKLGVKLSQMNFLLKLTNFETCQNIYQYRFPMKLEHKG